MRYEDREMRYETCDFTSRVMSASMEDDDRIGWSGLQILAETSKVQTLALMIPVPEFSWFKTQKLLRF